MSVENEIDRAIQRIAAFNTSDKKTEAQIEEIQSQVKLDYTKSNYDFSKFETLILHQSGKKRIVKQYTDDYSPENILCQVCKQILDRSFKIKYPNRNRIIKSLFNVIPAALQMSDFTIVKVDFHDYFNTISSVYVYEKYLKPEIHDRTERDLLARFVFETKYAYAGLSTSNAIAEIVAKYFDMALREQFTENGLIFFERYIDDCIIILNEHMEKIDIHKKLKKILDEIFFSKDADCHIKCKTKFNNNKFKYLSRRALLNNKFDFDFLGYGFWLDGTGSKINIKYGISNEKQKKYNTRIDHLISLYTDPSSPDYNNLELLRHRIRAFTSREVYLTKRFNTCVWRVKGFIANYTELRYFLGTDLLESNTKQFLESMVEDAFSRAAIPLPYFLKNDPHGQNRYNLLGNMKKNNTLLLVDRIGYDYHSLVKLCKQIQIKTIDSNGVRRGYGTLVRDYLIAVKVGY